MQTGKNRLLIPIVAMSLAGGVLSCSVPHSASATSGTAATPDVAAPTSSPTSIAWQSWSGDLFARAKHEHKFVLLDLEAVWCHWCHVEDDITYRDPQVIALINSKYIAVKVDQDSRPDISNRYEDYGWPATIVFNADAGEIVKRRGYLPPKEMASMLQAIIDDPTPGPSVEPATQIAYGNSDSLGNDLQNELEDKLSAGYDPQLGGWGHIHKYVDWDKMEFEMSRFRAGDTEAGRRAKQTLTAGLKLIDPVWGGVYQYSIDGDWDHPHFEKLMQFQGEQMRIYSLAYLTFGDPAYLKAADDIHRYIDQFLRGTDGAYEVSQDADLVDGVYAEEYFKLDDADRRKQGTPRVDTHKYTRENGWAISGLVGLYDAGVNNSSSDAASTLNDAITAANWVLAHRALPDGGFSHGEHGSAGPYLGDTLFMGRAFLDLYAATADRAWLVRAGDAAKFIGAHFTSGVPAGFATIATSGDASFPPQPEVSENVIAARFFNLLAHYTGTPEHHRLAERAMQFLATPAIAGSPDAPVAGILLAVHEFSSDPLHVTVVGSKSSPAARALFDTAITAPAWYKRIEWFDAAEGPLPNPDVDYPQFKFPAAFLCTGNACSSPVRKPEALGAKLRQGN